MDWKCKYDFFSPTENKIKLVSQMAATYWYHIFMMMEQVQLQETYVPKL